MIIILLLFSNIIMCIKWWWPGDLNRQFRGSCVPQEILEYYFVILGIIIFLLDIITLLKKLRKIYVNNKYFNNIILRWE